MATNFRRKIGRNGRQHPRSMDEMERLGTTPGPSLELPRGWRGYYGRPM